MLYLLSLQVGWGNTSFLGQAEDLLPSAALLRFCEDNGKLNHGDFPKTKTVVNRRRIFLQQVSTLFVGFVASLPVQCGMQTHETAVMFSTKSVEFQTALLHALVTFEIF